MTFCSNHDETREYIMECGRESSGKQYQITEKTIEKILKIYREIYMQIIYANWTIKKDQGKEK